MKNNLYKSNFFYSYILGSNKFKKKKLSPWIKILFYLVLLIVIILAFVDVGFKLSPRGWEIFTIRINQAFSFSNVLSDYPNYSLVDLSLQFLWISIKAVLIGTTAGFILGFITSTFTNVHFLKSEILSNFLKIFIVCLRALPTIIFIYFFTSSFTKYISLVLVLGWFSWIWLHKYMSEIYSNLDYYPYYVYLNQGNLKISAFLKTIIPQINNKFISLFLYSFDANMRWSSVLGTLGLAGIGQLIEMAGDNQFQSMGIPVLTIMIFMILLEFFIFLLNRFIFVHKSFVFNNNAKELISYIDYKKIIKWLLFVVLIVLLIVSFATLSWDQYSYGNSNVFNQFFYPNWNILVTKQDLNLFADIVKLIAQTVVIMFLVFLISFILIFISCYKLFKYYSLIGIFISAILRAIPIIAVFFLINPIYDSASSTICIILAISTATVMSKNITETINKLDTKIIQSFTILGYSKFKTFFKYVWPSVKNDYFSLFLFEWENQYRDLIVYGKYGVSAIGYYIDLYFNGIKKQVENMATFAWISFFIVLIVIFINYLIKLFMIEKKNILLIFHNWLDKIDNNFHRLKIFLTNKNKG